MTRTIKNLILGALVALLCAVSIAPRAFAQDAACAQIHVVEAGDWLSTIAQKFLGDAKAYPALVQATNDAAKNDSSFAVITDPNKIEVGQKLCIPAATAVPGHELAGIYMTSGPAADAPALIETLVLGGDGQVRYVTNYVGKAEFDAKGTWASSGDSVTVKLYEQAGRPVDAALVFNVREGNLIQTVPPTNQTYAKTSPEVAFYSGLYTSGRKNADGDETLVALTLLPDGRAELALNDDDTFVLQTGVWEFGKDADTGAQTLTVKLSQQAGQPIDETYVFQVDGETLRGTQYDSAKWGTDLAFTKYNAPTTPQTPATALMAQGAGRYTAQLPAADAIGRVIVLELGADGAASMTTQFIGKGEPVVETGTWALAGENYAVTLDQQTLVFKPTDDKLVLQDSENAGYGSLGLTLEKTPASNLLDAEYGGVRFRFDPRVAKAAQGERTAAIPVSEGPALGGGEPAAIRFLFNDQRAPEFGGYGFAQVNVYKTDDWVNLDPVTAKTVKELQTLLNNKPTAFPQELPVLPPANAAQVFHVHTKYLDFQNGSGVSFISYYAQDVSPVTADRIFFTFQGLTSDAKYYVAVFFPITTALLPEDYRTALGSMTDDEWAKQYTHYLEQLVKDLDGLNPAGFTPDALLLEELVKSIHVSETTLE